jgi:hypothetical protein
MSMPANFPICSGFSLREDDESEALGAELLREAGVGKIRAAKTDIRTSVRRSDEGD